MQNPNPKTHTQWLAAPHFLIAMAIFFVAAASLQAAPPSSYFKPDVPDFGQQDASLPDGGKYHCSPTSAANSLTAFDRHGIDVVPDEYDDSKSGGDHVKLIKKLGELMNTSKGTWNDDMVKGYRKYLRENSGGRKWDVKFQGSEYFRGYTVGSQGKEVNMDWVKQELADQEDVTLTMQWWKRQVDGAGVESWTPSGGAHSVTLDGYTEGTAGSGNFNNSSLLIRDPWYAEGIVERDPGTVGIGMPTYIYDTAGDETLRGVVVGAISVSPKPEELKINAVFSDVEFTNVPQITADSKIYSSVYGDYLHLGLDLGTALEDLSRSQNYSATVDIFADEPAIDNALSLQFDADGLLEVVVTDDTGSSSLLDLNDPEFAAYPSVEFASDFATSEFESVADHVLAEFFVDRELLGDFGEFGVDSFFDIDYQIDLNGLSGPGGGLLNPIGINGQQASLSPESEWLSPWPVPYDADGDLEPDYPTEYNPGPMPLFEQLARQNAIPEPGTLSLLGLALAGAFVRSRSQ